MESVKGEKGKDPQSGAADAVVENGQARENSGAKPTEASKAVSKDTATDHTAADSKIPLTDVKKKHGIYCRRFKRHPKDKGALDTKAKDLEEKMKELEKKSSADEAKIKALQEDKALLEEKMDRLGKPETDSKAPPTAKYMKRHSTSGLLKDQDPMRAGLVTLTPPPAPVDMRNFLLANSRFSAPGLSLEPSPTLLSTSNEYDTVAPFTSQKSLRERVIFKRQLNYLQDQVDQMTEKVKDVEGLQAKLASAEQVLEMYRSDLTAIETEYESLSHLVRKSSLADLYKETKCQSRLLARLLISEGDADKKAALDGLDSESKLGLLEEWTNQKLKHDQWTNHLIKTMNEWKANTDELHCILSLWQSYYLSNKSEGEFQDKDSGEVEAKDEEQAEIQGSDVIEMQEVAKVATEEMEKPAAEKDSPDSVHFESIKKLIDKNQGNAQMIRETFIDSIAKLYSKQNLLRLEMTKILGPLMPTIPYLNARKLALARKKEPSIEPQLAPPTPSPSHEVLGQHNGTKGKEPGYYTIYGKFKNVQWINDQSHLLLYIEKLNRQNERLRSDIADFVL